MKMSPRKRGVLSQGGLGRGITAKGRRLKDRHKHGAEGAEGACVRSTARAKVWPQNYLPRNAHEDVYEVRKVGRNAKYGRER